MTMPVGGKTGSKVSWKWILYVGLTSEPIGQHHDEALQIEIASKSTKTSRSDGTNHDEHETSIFKTLVGYISDRDCEKVTSDGIHDNDVIISTSLPLIGCHGWRTGESRREVDRILTSCGL
jgi:hypothetical protein